MKLSDTDKRLLTALGKNARMSWVQLSEKINLSASACQRRVEAMISAGLIRKFTTELDAHKMGYSVKAFIQVKVERQNTVTAEKFRTKVANYPEVSGFYKLSGNIDYLIKVTLQDIQALSEFIDSRLLALDGVVDASSSIVLEDLPCDHDSLF